MPQNVGGGCLSSGDSDRSMSERMMHINCLELLAGAFAVQSYVGTKTRLHIRLKIDNQTAVAYVNTLEGTRSIVLSSLALSLWDWALKRNIHLSAEHLPGIQNHIADWEFRHSLDSSDWKLKQSIFKDLMKIRGPCKIDLFAFRLNTQLPQYMSWKPDPQSVAVEVFQHPWGVSHNYAFPPFCLIGRCLAKVRRGSGKADLILITPVWPPQPWYPMILEMAVALPVLLPQLQDLLLSPQGQIHTLVLNKTLHLAAWHVSGSQCKQRGFQKMLPNSSLQHGGKELMQIITRPGKSGIAGAILGKLIHFTPLRQI
ncbi:uncharacterized protein LOC144433780 [Glandiceps talaboti]